jgi:hypothetical protein
MTTTNYGYIFFWRYEEKTGKKVVTNQNAKQIDKTKNKEIDD